MDVDPFWGRSGGPDFDPLRDECWESEEEIEPGEVSEELRRYIRDLPAPRLRLADLLPSMSTTLASVPYSRLIGEPPPRRRRLRRLWRAFRRTVRRS